MRESEIEGEPAIKSGEKAGQKITSIPVRWY